MLLPSSRVQKRLTNGRTKEECFAWAFQHVQAERAWAERDEIRKSAQRGKQQEVAYVMIDGTGAGIKGYEEFKECKSVLIFWGKDLCIRRSATSKRRIRRYLKNKKIHSHVGSKQEFKKYLWNALVEEGVLEASHIVWLGDGASWIWNLREELLPRSEGWKVTEVLDYYHCKQNLHKGAKALFGKDNQACSQWVREQTKSLWDNDGA